MIIASIFRNSTSYLERYWEQTDMLRTALTERDQPLRRVMVEGDSTDETWKSLQGEVIAGDTLLKCEHGGPMFRSKNLPMRWRQLALASNVAITAATRDNVNREPVVWMESDLIWDPATVLALLDHLHLRNFPAVAPMSMCGARFYDVWAYRKNGRYFSPYAPYHPDLKPGQMTQIDSNGSCFAMTADAADVVEFSMQDCILGVGRALCANGFSLWLDPTLAVRHPA